MTIGRTTEGNSDMAVSGRTFRWRVATLGATLAMVASVLFAAPANAQDFEPDFYFETDFYFEPDF
ncbi:MAG TPA: hypothetical protein QGH28_01175, partial [Chloroflexota bacterium]|nr:hypothetical protein [Chloroflexota bacterium]